MVHRDGIDFHSVYPEHSDVSFRNKYPKISKTKKCIVLDIDSTMVNTYDDYSMISKLRLMEDPSLMDVRNRSYFLTLFDVNGKKGKGDMMNLWGVTRPGLRDFLKFCQAYFQHVIVWSAGDYDYVHALCRRLFQGLKYPDAILTRDDCEEKHDKPVKPLAKIIEMEGFNHLTMADIIILDDRTYTFIPNVNNGVLIPEYSPEAKSGRSYESKKDQLRREDNALEQFQNWLLRHEVIHCNDVRSLKKDNIFT